MVEITQELLAKLEFQPKKQDADREELFRPGNVLRVRFHEDEDHPDHARYLLVGHINDDGSSYYDFCDFELERVLGIAHISQLFKED